MDQNASDNRTGRMDQNASDSDWQNASDNRTGRMDQNATENFDWKKTKTQNGTE